MKKKITSVLIIMILIITTIILLPKIETKRIEKYSYTTAICDESNYCEDYYIECENKNAKITPTGFSIQHNKEWQDPRESTNNYCD